VPLPRLQLFEFNDLAFVPAAVRDTVVESLGNTLAWGHILSGLVAPLEACLAATGCREVLDIGSGGGRPAAILVDEFRRLGHAPPRFLLTDLHPRPHDWAVLAAEHPEAIAFEPTPVDATAVPAHLGRGRLRTIINVLHHLPPELARAVLHDALLQGEGVFVAEGFERRPMGFVTMWPTGLPALLANPLLTRRDRLAKIALTWVTPAAALIGLWDGLVSTLRIYTPDDLRAMVEPLGPDFICEVGHFDYLWGGRGYWFSARRR
jgi:hypothetical protein